MKKILTTKDFQIFMLRLAEDIFLSCEELTKLDSAIGDGDLGMTLTIGFKEIKKILKEKEFLSISDVLITCSDAFESKAASTFATLLTIMLRKAGNAALSFKTVGTSEISMMLTSALESVQKRGKARLGDKTLLDSFIPAVEAFKKASTEKFDLIKATRKAVNAAELGAEATISMKARAGRSAYLGDRTIGTKDPGALAIVIMLQSFERYINNRNC